MENDKVKDDFKINKTNTDLTSLTTVAQECLRTTEPKVNNHSESSVQTPTQRKVSIELLTVPRGKMSLHVKSMDMPQKVTFDTIKKSQQKHIET